MISRLKMMAVAIAALITTFGCADKTKFTITGQTDSLANGTVKIMLFDPEKGLTDFITDTIVNNKFSIQGAVDQPVLAFLFLDGRSPVTDFMLQTGVRYKIAIKGDKAVVESASKEDILNQQLKALQNSDELQQLYVDLWAARSEKNEAKAEELNARIEGLRKDMQEKQIELIRNNPTLTAPAFRLFVKKSDPREGMEFADVKREFEAMGDAAKNSAAGVKLADYIHKMEQVAAGMPAPDFTATTPDGKEFRFSDVKANVKVLDFWASWCGPCRAASPEMVELYKNYKGKGLEIISFSLDNNADKWKEAIKEDGLNWIHASDLKGWGSEVAGLYMVNAIPTVYVIDENNVILGNSHAAADIKTIIENKLGM